MANLRFVIIGSGAAGTNAAFKIREIDQNASITIISEERYPCYFKGGLPNYLCGKVKKNELFIKSPGMYALSNIILRLSQKVVSIDKKNNHLYLAHRERIPYDRLLIATGTTRYIPPLFQSFSPSYSFLMNMEETETLISQKKNLSKPLVIGGGLTAIKLALALKEMGNSVEYCIVQKQMIKQLQDKEAETAIEKLLQREKIQTFHDKTIQSISPEKATYNVTFSTKETKKYSIIFLATGVRPNITLATQGGIKSDWGILVNNHFETSQPYIYAAGDIAQIYNPSVKDYWVNFGWPNAVKQGIIAAENMCGIQTEYEPAKVNIYNVRGHVIQYKNWE